jgi:general secretion pathway protein C
VKQFHDNSIMQMNSHSKWASRGVTFLLAALLAASGVYWVLSWPVTTLSGAVATPVTSAPSEPQAMARLLGGGSTAAQVAAPVANALSRFVLTGVVADKAQGGAALIALDGQASKPYRVGATVADGLVLQSVSARRAVLATALNAPASLTLEMKPLGK